MHKNEIGKLYDESLDAYDILYVDEQTAKYSEIFKLIEKSSLNIVDIGVGSGIFFDKCLNERYYLIGIDVSYKSLLRASMRGEKHYVDLIYGDGESPPIRPNSIDYAISVTVVHHFKDPYGFVKNIYNAVKHGMFISFLNKVFKEDDVRKIMIKDRCIVRELLNDFLIICKKF